MTKNRKLMIAVAMVVFSMVATTVQSYALRVLDYTYHCVGSGGNCLPTVVVESN